MTNEYPVYAVDSLWMIDPESMGSKEKFWYRDPSDDTGTAWLFKYPRPNSGEHWAEKIAAEVAQVLEIPHGRVELATCQGTRGTITESFIVFNETLVHGNELLTLAMSHYNPDQRRRPTQHNLDNIFWVLEHICAAINPDLGDRMKTQFAEYLVFDAIIGNTDRHHENWGTMLDYDERIPLRLAPTFDHASSLGRELSDERRIRHLAENTLGRYVARGRGGIYWSEDSGRQPCPLELVGQAFESYSDIFRPGLEKLANLGEGNILETLSRIPEYWITDSEKDFAAAMMQYNLEELRRLT